MPDPREPWQGTARPRANGIKVGLTRAVEARGDGVQERVLRRQESPHGRHLRRPWPPAPCLRGAGSQSRGREPSSAAPRRAPRPLAHPPGGNAHPRLAGPVSRPRARGRPRRRGREHGARPLALWPPTNPGLPAPRPMRSLHLPLAAAATAAPFSAADLLPLGLLWAPGPRSFLRLSGRSSSFPPSLRRPQPARR